MVMRFDLQSYTFDDRIMYTSNYQKLTITSKNIARCIALVGNIEREDVITSISVNIGSQSFYGKPYSTSYTNLKDDNVKYNNLGFDRPVVLVFNTDVLSTIGFCKVSDSPSIQGLPYQYLKYGYSDNVNDLVTGFYYLTSVTIVVYILFHLY